MIVTEGPTLEEKLIKVTPWWDVVSKYLIAAMMAIALTCIVVQVTKDNVICVPAVDCRRSTAPNGSLAVNVSGDSTKLCQSLTPKSSKKKVLAKMVDRRFYDYVDSVCFQELSLFTRFFPLILLGEAVLLLVFDILWTKLPYSFSVLNHFVDLADECYNSSATNDILGLKTGDSSSSGAGGSNCCCFGGGPPIKETDRIELLPVGSRGGGGGHEVDALKVLSLADKAGLFRDKFDKSLCLYHYYKARTFFQFFVCGISFAINILDHKMFFRDLFKTFQFKCLIDEFVFTQEYDHFECSHPLASYFQIAVILFLFFVCIHFVISGIALGKVWCCGSAYKKNSGDDFAFLFYLLAQHDKLYADRVSHFFAKNFKAKVVENLTRA